MNHNKLNYLFGAPKPTGKLRAAIDDFKVFEVMPFSPCGEGEHLLIHIRKTGANTVFVARELAKYFKVKEGFVTYAGLKDRFAITEQWFGVHVPGKEKYDLSDLAIEGVEVLSYARHNKKLRTGALTGNRFEIKLSQVTDIEELRRRWHAISEHGVPNYFGEQRFGINGGNIKRAEELFSGKKVKDKKKRGMYLSAARSLIFNHVVSHRIEQSLFDNMLDGDVVMLNGTQSVFLAEKIEDDLIKRLNEKDIDITAPMWGAGELMTTEKANELEAVVSENYSLFCDGLPRFGLKQERRKIRLSLKDCTISTHEDNVTVGFFLPAGSYATTVMRELLDYQDLTERVVKPDNTRTSNDNE